MTVCGVYVVRDDGAVLLQHRDNKPGLRHAGIWTVPGGQMNPGESPGACALREIEEETRYRCHDLHLLDHFDYNDGQVSGFFLYLYWTRYDGAQNVECLEGQELRFVARRDAESLTSAPFLIPYWDRAMVFLKSAKPLVWR